MKKAIIFDLFGTLCPATDPEARIIERFGLPKNSYDALERVVCGSVFNCWRSHIQAVVEAAGLKNNPKNRRVIKRIIEQEREKAVVFPDSRVVLEKLSRDYKLGLISNAYPTNRDILVDAGLDGFFVPQALLLSYETGMTKQNPKVFGRCLSALGVEPENAVMVGDSIRSDIKGAYNATDEKMKGILIAENPSQDARDYQETRGGLIVPSLHYVPEAVRKILS